MSGWTEERARLTKEAFYDFLSHCWVKSKELGYFRLGDDLLTSQVMVIDAIFDGLANDIHSFKFLKSRQLGVSTIVRAISLFWSGIFDLTAALIFDSADHLADARQELVDMLEAMDADFEFPRKKTDNRGMLVLQNKSRINMLIAGVKATKSSKRLGAGSAVSLVHRSELCNYGNPEALESFRHSMARENPDRLFMDESTAAGYNVWNDIWEEGKEDPGCKCVFLGWWSHNRQRIEKDHPDYKIYTAAPLSKQEKEKIAQVKELYNFSISAEQIAWIRKEMDPATARESDGEVDYDSNGMRLQEQAWTEYDAWQNTGSTFFSGEALTDQSNKHVGNKYSGFFFTPGIDFGDMRVHPSRAPKQIQLKVWEQPLPDSCYIIGADPAYGRSARSDRSCIQVIRAYADGLDQVAEYAWQGINSQQLAWVIVALEAWYSAQNSEIYRIVEVNGPGDATLRELHAMKQKIATGYFQSQGYEGLQDIQRNVRQYFYTRADAVTVGASALHVKTTEMLKVSMLERLRDFTENGMLRLRSQAAVDEMRSITREGDNIEAEGAKKDDRVMGLAFCVRMWDDRVRRKLMQGRRTREAEQAKRRMSVVDQVKLYNESAFNNFMAQKQRQRQDAQLSAMRGVRWGSRR